MSDDRPVPPDAGTRWAQADPRPSGTPDAAAERRLRRTRRRQVLAVLGASLGASVLA
jgi:hypothetical protein